jgi:flagellar assembly protein FliH
MISPSDAAIPDLNATVAGKKKWNHSWRTDSVLPLEFQAIDHPLRRRADWALCHDDDVDGRDIRLRDELEKLESRFRVQTQQVTDQIAETEREAKLEARREWEAELEERIATERGRVAHVCAEFVKSRDSYFAAVEEEVVRLALAIAARVLHREAKLDPLLLSAVVRMALEKVAEDSGVSLHVPIADVAAWRAMLAQDTQSAVRLVGEERMNAAECVLETSVGRVEMGVVAQLEEIEKGFFDLLQQRPL